MRGLILLVPVLLSGCDLSMTRQQRHDPQGGATLWPGGPPASDNAPAGTVAQDQPARDRAIADPPQVTPALLARGEQRYRIFCTPCHGASGDGDGRVVGRGFPRPPSLHEPRLVGAPASHTVDVITRGYGIMYPFADRIEPADRWAIAAYVKALQRLPAGKGAGA